MKSLALASGLLFFSSAVSATPISFTGAELAALPSISFPTGTQTIFGDSLRIDASTRNSAIVRLPFDLFDVDVSDFEVQINFTRLRRDDGLDDHDPTVFLSDGFNLFGAGFGDSSNNGVNASPRVHSISPDQKSLNFDAPLTRSADIVVPLGSSFLATIRIQSTGISTTITSGFNNGSISATGVSPTLFDPNNGGPSLIIGSNDVNENYQINSLSFTRGVSLPTAVPEPNALAGLGIGLLGFSLYRRRRR